MVSLNVLSLKLLDRKTDKKNTIAVRVDIRYRAVRVQTEKFTAAPTWSIQIQMHLTYNFTLSDFFFFCKNTNGLCKKNIFLSHQITVHRRGEDA
jgi:hypothetical protein